MIGRILGEVIDAVGEVVVLDVGGVGYEVNVTPRTAASLGAADGFVTVHTHLHVREDAMVLFGFLTASDRDVFRVLLGAQGVGPKVALGMLGVFTADELRRVVATEDVDGLTAVPGIGKRTAQKIVLDLKPKLAAGEADVVESDSSQVRQALEGLGYSAPEIREAIAGLDPSVPVAEQIRTALKVLGR